MQGDSARYAAECLQDGKGRKIYCGWRALLGVGTRNTMREGKWILGLRYEIGFGCASIELVRAQPRVAELLKLTRTHSYHRAKI